VPWTRGRALVWDFTCCDTLVLSYVNSTSVSHGAAARLAFEKKIKKYEFLSERYIMMPVAVETFGSWASESLQFIQEIGRRIALRNGDPRSTTSNKMSRVRCPLNLKDGRDYGNDMNHNLRFGISDSVPGSVWIYTSG